MDMKATAMQPKLRSSTLTWWEYYSTFVLQGNDNHLEGVLLF
jgi:hypothetical protein